jgi:phospholipid-binding lipoprotein MlaA
MQGEKNALVRFGVVTLLAAALLSGGCASTTTRSDGSLNPDPLEPANRVFFTFNETLDKILIKPISEGYADITPRPIRTAVTNFFDNLTYLNVILNQFLQGKFDRGISDIGRFIVNSTFGVGGLFDVATGMGLPKHNEDLGQTFGVWGASQGAYLYLPIKGPNSVRDAPDMVTATLLNPMTYLTGVVLFPVTALNIINSRANLLEETRIRDEAAVDVYSFTREAYIQRRAYMIYDGFPPSEGYESIFDNDFEKDSVLIIE